MGSTTVYHSTELAGPFDPAKAFEDRREADRAYHGSDPYGGSFAHCPSLVLKPDLLFVNRAVAEAWLEENTRKRGPAVAVRYLPQGPDPDTKDKELRDEVRALFRDTAALGPSLVARARSAKARTRRCRACGSGIATAHIKEAACPVCGDAGFIETKADRARREAIHATFRDARIRLDDYRRDRDAKRLAEARPEECPWLIGATVAC